MPGLRRRWYLPLATALLTSTTAVVINFATDLQGQPWLWVAVVVLTLLSALVPTSGAAADGPVRQYQTGGTNSTNYQAGRDLTIGRDPEGKSEDGW